MNDAMQAPLVTGASARPGMSDTAMRSSLRASAASPSERNQPPMDGQVLERRLLAVAADLQVNLAIGIAHRGKNVDKILVPLGEDDRRWHGRKFRLPLLIQFKEDDGARRRAHVDRLRQQSAEIGETTGSNQHPGCGVDPAFNRPHLDTCGALQNGNHSLGNQLSAPGALPSKPAHAPVLAD